MDKKLKDQFIFDLGKIIKFNSVLTPESNNKPFGEQIDSCLNAVLDICKNIGFNIKKDPNGFYGYAELGEGSDLVGILAHIDVVPTGDISSWNSDPFKLNFKNGKVHARGILDDKGPLMSVIYSFKSLIDDGHVFNKRFRIIIGTDEENLWRCIDSYKEKEEIPIFSFTPDCSFPVVNAEKGLLQFDIISKSKFNMDLSLGDAYNMIPGKCLIDFNGISKDDIRNILDNFDSKIKYEFLEDKLLLQGTYAHASRPDLGVNVLPYAIYLFKELGYKSKIIDFFSDQISFTSNGEMLFGEVLSDLKSGVLTLSLTKASFSEEGDQVFSFDMRYPIDFSKDELINKINICIKKYDLFYSEVSYLDPIYVDSNLKFVKTLIEVYEKFTKETGVQPTSTGGATYARALPNCVSFGPLFPNRDNTAHQIDESINEEDLFNLILIYKEAIKKLNF